MGTSISQILQVQTLATGTPPGPAGTPVASNVTSTGFTLTWPATTAGSPPFQYMPQIKLTSTTAFTNALAQPTSALSAVIAGLQPGSLYDVAVETITPFPPPSLSPQIVVQMLTVPPSIPVLPAPTSIGTTTATFSWTASTGTGPITYALLGRTPSGVGSFVSLGSTQLNTITVTGLTPASKYDFALTASNSAGTLGQSATVTATTANSVTVPGPPGNLALVSDTSNSATVSWTAPNTGGAVTSYTVSFSAAGGGTAQITGLTILTTTVPSLQPNTSYTMTVAALNSGGTSLQSNVLSFTTPGLLVRSPFLQPGGNPGVSPWNTGIGSGAVLSGATDPDTLSLISKIGTVNAAFFGKTIVVSDASHPMSTFASTSGSGSQRDANLTVSLHCPAGTTPTGPFPGDNDISVFDTTISPPTVFTFGPCTLNNGVDTQGGVSAVFGEKNLICGSCADALTGNFGYDSSLGTIQPWELDSTKNPSGRIRHVLRFALDVSQLLPPTAWNAPTDPTTGAVQIYWPQTHTDFNGPTAYFGKVPAGALVCIPVGDVEPAGLSAGGHMLYDALKYQGAMWRDQSSGGFTVYADKTLDQHPMIVGMRGDMQTIASRLRIVRNVGPSAMGGGGTILDPNPAPLVDSNLCGGTVPPGAPTGLVSTGVTPTSIALAWNTGSGATPQTFTVQDAPAGSGSWTTLVAGYTPPPPSTPAPTPPPTTAPTRLAKLQTGNMYWGAAGHRGRAPYNTTISLSQQIADLRNVFGTVPNTTVYRALGEEQFNVSGAVNSDVVALQAAGIIPIVQVYTFPNWSSFATEAASYAAANAAVAANCAAAPTNLVWEVGNEWVLQSIQAQMLGDGSTAADWTSAPLYPIYRGAMAGAIAAIRDSGIVGAQIIGGALAGWTFQGLSIAFAADLASYAPQGGRNLTWDVEVMHTYDDVSFPGNNQIPDPSNFNGGMSYFVLQKPVGRPIFFTEFGSSTNNVPAQNASAAANLVSQANIFLAHQPTTAAETGCLGGCVYQLYQTPDQTSQAELGYFLYTWSGSTTTIAPQGAAMKNFVAANAPPVPPPPTQPPVSVPPNTFTAINLAPSTAFDFRVSATNAGGTGSFSSPLLAVSTAAAAASTTFDPASSTMVLSNANLTATSTGGSFQTARSTTGITSTGGLRQFEVTMVTGSTDVGFGIINQSYVFGQTSGIGGDVNGVGFYPTISGNIYCGSPTPLVNGTASSASGEVVTCVFDPATPQIWFSDSAMRAAGMQWNWSTSANPATGVGGVQLTALVSGTYFIAVNDNVGGAVSTVNTGNSAFTVPLVTGAQAWDTGAIVGTGTAPGTMGAITVGVVTSNTAALSWSAPTGTPTFTYTLQQAPAVGGPFTTVASIFSATSTTVGSLAPATQAFFRVQATNSAGTGGFSPVATVLTLAATIGGSTSGLLSTGPLSTLGNQIVDAAGNPQRMSGGGWAFGYNRPNQLIGLDSCTYQQFLDTVKAVGFNTLRLHTSDRAVLNGDPAGSFSSTLNPSFVGKTYLQCLGLIMDYGATIGLRFIVDSHSNEGNIPQQSNGIWYDVGGGSNGTDGNGQTGTITDAQWIQAWQARASAFVGKPALIGYDLRNEPLGYNGDSTWGNMAGATPGSNRDIKDAYQRAGNAIHAIDSAKPLIICEGPQNYTGNYAGVGGLFCPQGDLTGVTTQPVTLTTPNKVVYSVHNYPASVSSFTPDSGAGAIAQWMGAWGFVFQNNIAPILIGEGGTVLTSAADQAWAQTLVSFCNGTAAGGITLSGTKQGIGVLWWNMSSQNDPSQGAQFSMLTGYINGSLRASNAATLQALQFKQATGGGGPTGVAPPIVAPLGAASPGSWTLKSINGMFYWELLPQGYSTAASYPLMLCLHQLDQGDSFYSNGNNPAADIVMPQWDPWVNNAAFRKAHPAIVLLPLLDNRADTSGNTLNWGGITSDQQPSQTNYIALVKSYMQTFSVNPNKVYITGNSMGGDGAWDVMIKYNTKHPLVSPIFASAAILAGVTFAYNYPNPTATMIANMKPVPLVVIHGGNNDTNSPIAWDDAMSAVIGTQVGGNMHYTRDNNLSHDVWDTYYVEPLAETVIWSFLFAQNF